MRDSLYWLRDGSEMDHIADDYKVHQRRQIINHVRNGLFHCIIQIPAKIWSISILRFQTELHWILPWGGLLSDWYFSEEEVLLSCWLISDDNFVMLARPGQARAEQRVKKYFQLALWLISRPAVHRQKVDQLVPPLKWRLRRSQAWLSQHRQWVVWVLSDWQRKGKIHTDLYSVHFIKVTTLPGLITLNTLDFRF